MQGGWGGGRLTIHTCFHRSLNRLLEESSVSPNVDHSTKLGLNLCGSTLISRSDGLGNDRREGDQEIIFMTGLGLLGHLWNRAVN